jgi:glutamate/tyrosine decarboxylase-like PLP-dependent enzyme
MKNEETLDPQDWCKIRQLGHRMIDDMFDHLENLRDQSAWQPMPDEVKNHLQNQSLPNDGQNPETIYQDFLQNVRPYPRGNIHPRYWGWVEGTGTPLGVLAEMLSAGMNSNANFGEQSSVYIELQVIDWCKEMLGFPKDASGILVSGGSMANLTGLAVARNAKADFDIQEKGLQSVESKMVLYGSSETHNSVQKAIELFGLGNEAFRRIPVDENFEINLEELSKAIAKDKADGLKPFCVIGNAGTVNTGATDNLEKLADICESENLWFHVDGAFGALAYLSENFRPKLKGMERADSLAFDLHKWMYMPYEAGCVLIRDKEKHHQTFSPSGGYLAHLPRGLASGSWLSEYGLQLSRSFKALKIWMSLREHGIEKYRRLIEQNIEQAKYLAELVEKSDDLELLAPVPMNVVCFRFVKEVLSDEQLNELNREILMRIHESGIAVPSYTTIKGKFGLRCAITNHRSLFSDFDLLIEKVLEIGKSLD